MIREKNRVVVEGLNLVKRHMRRQEGQSGGIIAKSAPVHVSTVSLLDPKDSKPTRVGFRFNGAGKRERYSVRSGETIDKPVLPRRPLKPDGPKDTAAAVVLEQTFKPRFVDLPEFREGVDIRATDVPAPTQ